MLYQPSTQASRDAVRTANAVTADAEWSSPRPLLIRPRPAMPVHCLPSVMADFVESVKSSTQTPGDLAGMLALAAAVIPLTKRLQVKITDDWFEPLQLFVIVEMESGERKSAVFRLVTEPISAYERRAAANAEADIAERDSERRVLLARIDNLEKRLAKADDKVERLKLLADLKAERDDLLAKPQKFAPVLFLDDVTPEALAEEMARQGGRMAIMSPEGGTFNIMAGTYSDGNARLDLYLKGHAGEDVRVNRMTRVTYIPEAALVLALAVQRTVLEEAGSNAAFQGKGLLARMLPVCPESRIGFRELDPTPISGGVRKAYADMINTLLETKPDEDPDGNPTPHTLTLSPGADAAFRAFRERVEVKLRDGEQLGSQSLRSWGSKLPGAVARIAGILHAAGLAAAGRVPRAGQIADTTMTSAITIGETFLLPHALYAFGVMGADAGIGVAQRALALIVRREMKVVSRRDVQRELGLPKVEQADEAIRVLEEHGFLRVRTSTDTAGKPGRKSSPEYDVNPLAPTESETPKQFDVFDRTDDVPRRAA